VCELLNHCTWWSSIHVSVGRCKSIQPNKAKLETQGSSLLKEKGCDYVVSLEAKMKACLSHL